MFSIKARTAMLAFGAIALSMSEVYAVAQQGHQPPRPAQPTADLALQDLFGKAAKPVDPDRLPQPTDMVIVKLKPGVDARQFGSTQGLRVVRGLKSDPRAFVFRAKDVATAQRLASALARNPNVELVAPELKTAFMRSAFVPNDPFFFPNNPVNGWSGQWHLKNQVGGLTDARLEGAWAANATGTGVTVGIVDDSVEMAHPDLSPNIVGADSWDFGQNDADPSPVWSDDQHGVSVAGVAAARGGNGIGVTGAAPFAGLAGLRIDFINQTTSMFADATLFHSSGGNTNIKVKNHSYGYSVPFIPTTLESNALATSSNSGTIHCLSAGNNRGTSGEDSNKLDIQNDPATIVVAAIASNGVYSWYSNFGASVAVTAPSNGVLGVMTTDRTGAMGYNPPQDSFPDTDYTSVFGGTSSASPLVAGIMALAKQVQPALDGRFAKHLLAITSDQVDPFDVSATSDGGWRTNAAGIKFNQNYGFGMINAANLVAAAQNFTGVTPLVTETTGTVTVNAAIPDNDLTGVQRTFELDTQGKLEEVLVNLNISHTFRGDLEAYLTSPSGTTSRLMIRSASDSADNISWTFSTNAFWGENAAGTWVLKVADRFGEDLGTWNSYTVTSRLGQLVQQNADDAEVVSTTIPNPMVAGQSYYVRVIMENTGTNDWEAPNYQLQSQNPVDNLIWDYNRINLRNTNDIDPGESKNFGFTVHAPTEPGIYPMQWRMAKDGVGFGDPTSITNVEVKLLEHAARFVTHSTPTSVQAGSTFQVSVRFRNVGTRTWTAATGFKMATTDPNFTDTWGVTSVNLAPGDSIPRGSSKLFTFNCTAPNTPGTYLFRWRMYRDGRGFFGDRNVTRNITVTP